MIRKIRSCVCPNLISFNAYVFGSAIPARNRNFVFRSRLIFGSMCEVGVILPGTVFVLLLSYLQ